MAQLIHYASHSHMYCTAALYMFTLIIGIFFFWDNKVTLTLKYFQDKLSISLLIDKPNSHKSKKPPSIPSLKARATWRVVITGLKWKDKTESTYRLHQDVVLSKQKCGSGVLVEGFNVVPHPHERAIVHAPTGLSLLDLTQEVLHIWYYTQLLIAGYMIKGQSRLLLSNQGGPSGGRILPTVAAVDTMPLHELVGGRVGPEMVCGLNFGVLQSTRADCKDEGWLVTQTFSSSE